MSNDTAVEPGVELEINDRLRPLIMQAIGQASVCWENLDSDAIFNAGLAIKVGESLLHEIQLAIEDFLA